MAEVEPGSSQKQVRSQQGSSFPRLSIQFFLSWILRQFLYISVVILGSLFQAGFGLRDLPVASSMLVLKAWASKSSLHYILIIN